RAFEAQIVSFKGNAGVTDNAS
ncbi:MAG: hypothetical protein RL564_652, partial [Pseudomonadota bacterium]